MKTIVVATDGSEGAGAALELAAQIAGETGAELCCVSVDDSLDTTGIDPAPEQRAKPERSWPANPGSRQKPWQRSARRSNASSRSRTNATPA